VNDLIDNFGAAFTLDYSTGLMEGGPGDLAGPPLRDDLSHHAHSSDREDSTMPANRGGGDSKQGLIIALVCFVVLTLLLAVFTVLGYTGQSELQKNTEAEAKKAKEADAERDWYKCQALVFKASTADLKVDKEREDLPVLRDKLDSSGFDSKEGAQEVKGLLKTLEDKYGVAWDGKLKKSKATLTQVADQLAAELNAARQAKAAAEDREQKALAKFKQDLQAKEEESLDWQKKFKAAQDENVKDRKAAADTYDKELERFAGLSKEKQDLKTQLDTETDKLLRIKAQLESQIKSLTIQKDKLVEQMTPPDLFKADTPKGKIVRLDPAGEMAWVDIGSADNVNPHQNLTFSIFGKAADGRPTDRKGAVEVVDVEGPHLSKAKITDQVEAYRNPILTGDLLINPAWTPSSRFHVAITGQIDIYGDGKNHVDEFIRTLEKQGMAVDAYLDLKDLSIKGPGMTPKTNFLIVGDVPEFKKDSSIQLEDPRVERKQQILGKISEMKKEAFGLGITEVRLQRFVALTGYRLPRGARFGEGQGMGFDTPVRSSATKETKEPREPKETAPKESKEDEPKEPPVKKEPKIPKGKKDEKKDEKKNDEDR
jgi:hypothetical protein